MMRSHNRMQGFTLIELLMVIVITGILAPVIATFIKQPVDAYFNSVRRAALTDEADTAIRRMARDIHKALPNSIRNPDNNCIEFIPTKTGGRYRAEKNSSGDGDILDFTTVSGDDSFDMFGLNNALPADQRIAADDMIAVYNLGMTGANAYTAENTATVDSVGNGDLTGETKITFTASKQFPLASSSHRFHVIPGNEKIVSFVCSGNELYRTSNYAYTDSCSTIGGALLAQHVTSCAFAYNNFEMQRNGLVQMTITLTDDSGESESESVSLYHEAHVDNSP